MVLGRLASPLPRFAPLATPSPKTDKTTWGRGNCELSSR
jgi:hypothetical protein